jgi:ion channel-forming bestrophin family protein
MITYDSKNWVRVVCSYRGTVMPAVLRRLWWLVLVAVGVVAVEMYAEKHHPDWYWFFKLAKPTGHSLLGLALGLLIVFHNNCAYDRYWEGRKLWGSLVNTSRNLVRGATAFVGPSGDLANLVAAYALALKQLLRGDTDLSEIKDLIPPDLFEQVVASSNPPNLLALHMSRWIADRQAEGKIDSITAQSLEAMVRGLLDHQGGCERILRTPIPFAYAVHIRQMLLVYLVTLPFALAADMGWATIPTVAVVAFGMIGIEEAGNEIEDPFGTDPNDLPLEAICATIGRDAKALAG